MEITFDVPDFITEILCTMGGDPNQVAKELVLVEWFRMGWISHPQLAGALGLDRFEADALLKRHAVPDGLTHEEVDAEVESFRSGGPGTHE